MGEETGGGYQGNTSGLIPEEELSSGIVVAISLLKYVNVVDQKAHFGHGTIPAYPIVPSINIILNKKDLVLKKLHELIEKQNNL
ncbi:MAG: hypothetical protein R3E32_26085 [Chitinophagales bacterium]